MILTGGIIVSEDASILEMGSALVASIEIGFNEIMQSAGLSELAFYEAEGEQKDSKISLSEIKTKVVNFFKDLWEKVQRFLDTIERKFHEIVDPKVAKIEAASKDKLMKMAQKIKDKDKNGNPLHWGTVNVGMIKNPNGVAKVAAVAYQEGKDFNTVCKEIYAACGQQEGPADMKAVTDAVKKFVEGEEEEVTKEFIIRNLDGFITSLKQAKQVKQDIQKHRKSLKAGLDMAIKVCNDANGDDASFKIDIAKKQYQLKINLCTTLLHAQRKQTVSYLSILMRLLAASVGVGGKGPKENDDNVIDSTAKEVNAAAIEDTTNTVSIGESAIAGLFDF